MSKDENALPDIPSLREAFERSEAESDQMHFAQYADERLEELHNAVHETEYVTETGVPEMHMPDVPRDAGYAHGERGRHGRAADRGVLPFFGGRAPGSGGT